MTIYRIKVGYHNPSALTFRQLNEVLVEEAFRLSQPEKHGFRYFTEYEYETETGDLCSVCSLAYSRACRVKKCPLVLVEIKPAEQNG